MKKRMISWESSRYGGHLGRHVEHDPRSHGFPVSLTATAPVGVLHPVTHHRYGKILDQGELGSCTGNALVGALMTGPLYRTHHNYGESMAVRLYKRATVLDPFPGEYPPDDTGSSGLAVCKAALEKGLITRYEHAFNLDQALAALQGGPVITGIDWHEGFDRPDPSTGLVRLTGNVRGGHEVVIRGYDPGGLRPWGIGGTEPTVLGDNSWTYSWGRRGSFVMTVADWATLLDNDGDVTRPIR